ncbi:unnamed protein product, partial [Prorocentrum cordatum]
MVNAEIEQLVGSALDGIPIDVDAGSDMGGIESESYPQLLNGDWPRSNVSSILLDLVILDGVNHVLDWVILDGVSIVLDWVSILLDLVNIDGVSIALDWAIAMLDWVILDGVSIFLDWVILDWVSLLLDFM